MLPFFCLENHKMIIFIWVLAIFINAPILHAT